MGRYLEAVKVVLAVTLINCSMSASNGLTSTERVKTERKRKLECLKQKIARCEISNDQTDCKEYEDIQKSTEDTEDVDLTEVHYFLVKLAPKVFCFLETTQGNVERSSFFRKTGVSPPKFL